MMENEHTSPRPAGHSARSTGPAPSGYELFDELGRGGMGTVWRARDLRLAREVAVKVLRDEYPFDSLAAERFRAEARITGQLQHPGIPAVHELGALPDGRPFLAMKLVKGQTLHELLGARPDPDQGRGAFVAVFEMLCDAVQGVVDCGSARGRFVAVFEQVCHAVGYAHAHQVIHRDLKPANVMVGAHGEVQVMDWGLAKVLGENRDREQAADDPSATAAYSPAPDSPGTPGTPESDSATQTGSVLGTPAYMPPEQAGGEVRRLDARSDVFGLGAILCQILTGEPPYRGESFNDLRLKAVRWETQEAFARLDGCAAEPDLVALCKRCLAFKQEDRPADGGMVAQEVARIRQAAEERARQAELQRAEALVREEEQCKRRRVLQWAGGAIAVVLLLGIAGTTIGLVRADDARQAEQDRAEREAAAKRDAHYQRNQAEGARQRTEEVLLESRQRLALNYLAYGQLCAAASRLANTKDWQEGDAAREAFHKLSDWVSAVGDPAVKPALAGFSEALAQWTNGPPPGLLRSKSLQLAHACRDSWLKNVDREFPTIAGKIRSQLYHRACRAVDQLAKAKSWESGRVARQDFWELYWGELAIVESDEVASAMVRIDRAMEAWQPGAPPPSALRELATELRRACGIPLAATPN